MRKICKYCRADTHVIDKCPSISCKKCKKLGHPHWKCFEKEIIKNRIDDNKYAVLSHQEITEDMKLDSIEDYLRYKDKKWIDIC